MNNLPIHNIDYKKLLTYFVAIVLVFFGVFYITNRISDQLSSSSKNQESKQQTENKESYFGRVKYLMDRSRVGEGISFFLADDQGKELYLLQSNDDKLTLVENHDVTVYGYLGKSSDNQRDVLIVTKVVLSGDANVSN